MELGRCTVHLMNLLMEAALDRVAAQQNGKMTSVESGGIPR